MEIITSNIYGSRYKRSVWLSLSGGKNPKSLWWNDEKKVAVRRNEAAWKKVLAASHEEAKERCIKAYREEK